MKNPPYIKIISVSFFTLFSSFLFSCHHEKTISHHIEDLAQFHSKHRKQSQLVVSEELITKQKQLIKSFSHAKPHTISIDEFEASIFFLYEFDTFSTLKSCYATIATALKTLHNIKGFTGLMRMLLLNLHQPGSFSGFLYELEKGLHIHKHCKHEHIVEFQQIIAIPDSKRTREFDIVTSKRIIECKNINWKKQKLRKQFLAQKRVVEKINKKNRTNFAYEVCSKKPIPQNWQRWFTKNKIKFSSDESE